MRNVAVVVIVLLLSITIHISNAFGSVRHNRGIVTRAMCINYGKHHGPRQYSSYRRCMKWARRHNALILSTNMSASWYGPGLYGNGMACGGILTTRSMVVAHKTLRCGTSLVVCYRRRCVNATVQDRGPFIKGRDIDLAGAVAVKLNFGGVGIVRVSRL